ncbi:hypothetical protein AGDE_07619 [Angomonas deanei]|uniref:Chromo (CHRromatin Organisation MOdifier) domain containing protein, putative n=1 Tax=Angomonas deanei TaxID=59799 RepID=A0A7G2CKF2_9TRYP|nr:hypothetical protein AGDE_07619 [Angomonas deanei]CAD2220348.1 Chromo (CHRromatin Organisation MOdifier) domain containing protein, putative [Angomonas deanei]|eukprot:EPY35037.1 hypothetical protein AGDE_07619 [Angomonas deanei]
MFPFSLFRFYGIVVLTLFFLLVPFPMDGENVEKILKRRINNQTGSVEYLVKWRAAPAYESTWESRESLLAHSGDLVQQVDEQYIEKTDHSITNWRNASGRRGARKKKRGRTEPERLSAVYVRGRQGGTAMLLGDVMLPDGVGGALLHNGSHKKNGGRKDALQHLYTLAETPSRQWRARWGQGGLLPACDKGSVTQSLTEEFHTSTPGEVNSEEDTYEEEGIEVVDIVPADEVRSGAPYVAPSSLVHLIGVEESELLRQESVAKLPRLNTHINEILCRKYEPVVRYAVYNVQTQKDEVKSMPLSVFRMAYPQTLISYLLSSAIVVENVN